MFKSNCHQFFWTVIYKFSFVTNICIDENIIPVRVNNFANQRNSVGYIINNMWVWTTYHPFVMSPMADVEDDGMGLFIDKSLSEQVDTTSRST